MTIQKIWEEKKENKLKTSIHVDIWLRKICSKAPIYKIKLGKIEILLKLLLYVTDSVVTEKKIQI